MVFNTVMLTIRGKVGLVVGHTLFKLVPVRPAVLDGVVLKHVEAFDVFMIGVLGETMKSFTLILFCKFFHKEHIF
mgnify:CR=1 FL=1